ncbi:DUF1365 domain-containing protein [Psychromonas sp. PT13]|uniref:DUF1365 domain-containing protein n=1 Tax=Psychromonas sp. PT13 TaxID=3439547 RepID=UPI003EB96655
MNEIINQELKSGIYKGWVGHRRFSPKPHSFKYGIFLLAIDLDELPKLTNIGPWFKSNKFAPLNLKCSDYLDHKSQLSKQDVWLKIQSLGAKIVPKRVMFIGQLRCFGLYFSPINAYYCFDQDDQLIYLLAEVSNTPWNERHYYLIPLNPSEDKKAANKLISEKVFHVSPFMDLNMEYQWVIKKPADQLKLHIQNMHLSTGEKVFDASLTMQRMDFTNKNLRSCLASIPMMTLKTLWGIYWQALKLFIKGVPYVAHPQK